MSDSLDPSALVSNIPNLLPPDNQCLNSECDALTALLHAAMVAVGFRLVGIGHGPSTQELPGSKLPETWNKDGPESYTLRYKHEQSSLAFLLKVIKLGQRSLIHAIALESDKTYSLDILTSDYLSSSYFPYAVDAPSGPLVHGYISSSRIKDLMSLYKLNIIQRLVPGLRKDGYQEQAESANAPAAERNPQPRQPPRTNSPPYAEPPIRSPGYDPLRIPNIGRSDLDPIPRGNPFAPPSLFGNEEDGMYVGPSHPIFRDRLGPRAGGIGDESRGPWGGDGYLPPMGAPPGARFDPVGPGPMGGGLPGRFGGPSRGGPFGGPFRGRGGGEPDNDEFMPPGVDDMYS
ncbi:hypothetical protein FRB99_001119 [Tulasnella sp. 403]|nr:hypothetical protein FRB99_001119 [Tulasnella sp. 403]